MSRTSRPPPVGELVLELPCKEEALTPVHAVRGTVLLASLSALRELSLFDRYRQRLEARAAPAVLEVVAGEWVSLDTAFAHYSACETLQLSPSQQVQVGRIAGAKAIGTMLGTAVRLSRGIGATPWTLLKGADRIWNRAYNGGGLRIYKLGASDALVETHANPLFSQLPFCRNSFIGFSAALYGALSDRISIRDTDITQARVVFRMVWQ